MRVLFLWHMHQPSYVVYEKDGYVSYLPWVLLHALREYYEMPRILAEFDNVKVTFNLVPSLIEQLELYARGEVKCIFTEMVLKPAGELTDAEKEFILYHFFNVNPKTRVKPYRRYELLYLKRGAPLNLGEKIRRFKDQEYRDIQFFYLFSSISPLLIEETSFLKELLLKERDYSEEDKKELLKWMREKIFYVIGLYRDLVKKGKIEISTSPFYHPIMPVLYNSRNVIESNPYTLLPSISFSKAKNVDTQIRDALHFMENKIECKILGIWPPEGSVSPDIIPLLKKYDIQWIATDEGILEKSLYKAGKTFKRSDIYRVYEFNGVKIFFRDRELSDRIGFIYSRWSERQAAKDFIERLRHLAREHSHGVVSIILDGENPWENYSEGGINFLRRVYEELSKSSVLNTVTFSEVVKDTAAERLSTLHPGSWIKADFSTWIGHPEKNRAWEYLIKVKDLLEEKSINNAAKRELMAAEGSDWFWWYGDDNFTLYSREFDAIFRRHLIRAMELASMKPEEFLWKPIRTMIFPVQPITPETCMIRPVIDGEFTSYFEWLGAGKIELDALSTGIMRKETKYFKEILFGFDEGNFYLALVPLNKDKFPEKVKILSNEKEVEINFKNGKIKPGCIRGTFNKIVELSIPLSYLGYRDGYKLYVEVYEGGEIEERYPLIGEFELKRFKLEDEEQTW